MWLQARRRFIAAPLLLALISGASSAASLNQDETEIAFWRLMTECFGALRSGLPENISTEEIAEICECSSMMTAKAITREDIYAGNKERVAEAMQHSVTICFGKAMLNRQSYINHSE